MRSITLIGALSAACLLLISAGCSQETGNSNTGNTNAGVQNRSSATNEAGPLPENAFKAQIALVAPPAKLRAGQKETIQVKIKNVSDAPWYARGGEINTNPDNRFYLAAGNRWLKSDGQTVVTNMDGRRGLPRDLKPGEEDEVPLQITAPKDPGDYILEIDLVQEQVAWFGDKGSPTAKTKLTVVK